LSRDDMVAFAAIRIKATAAVDAGFTGGHVVMIRHRDTDTVGKSVPPASSKCPIRGAERLLAVNQRGDVNERAREPPSPLQQAQGYRGRGLRWGRSGNERKPVGWGRGPNATALNQKGEQLSRQPEGRFQAVGAVWAAFRKRPQLFFRDAIASKTRTCEILPPTIRKPPLYPPELRARAFLAGALGLTVSGPSLTATIAPRNDIGETTACQRKGTRPDVILPKNWARG
jgi:hypothetical protein